MRFVYAFAFAALLLGFFVWLNSERPAASTPIRAPIPAAHESSVSAGTVSAPSRNVSAARAIRSPVVAQAPAKEPAIATSADKNTTNLPATSTMQAGAAKPAVELFGPLVDDDPNNVFLASTVQYHAAVQSEAVDPEWGPVAAQVLRDHLASQWGDRYEIALIDCRTDLCEVRIAARVGSDAQPDIQEMQESINRMKHEPWWSAAQFDQDMMAVGVSPDGRALVLWFISRK